MRAGCGHATVTMVLPRKAATACTALSKNVTEPMKLSKPGHDRGERLGAGLGADAARGGGSRTAVARRMKMPLTQHRVYPDSRHCFLRGMR